MNRRRHTTPPAPVITYRYTSPQFAQDCRSLQRLRRRDDRMRAIRRVLMETLVKAVVPSVTFAVIVATLHPYR